MREIIFITFDQIKEQYPATPYSIAVLMASLTAIKIKASHFPIYLQQASEEKKTDGGIADVVKDKLLENISYFKRFNCIAIGVATWSIDYCKTLLNNLEDYKGKIILGGYEITAMSEETLMNVFPKADYFIKGYAEKSLKKILQNKCKNVERIINEKNDSEDMVSPYLSGVLNLSSRKIHWETKRGCPYRCGFCEWGNATKDIIQIDAKRLSAEIQLFGESDIEEINILDSTFNFGNEYLKQFKALLNLNYVKINCQVRFENIDTKDGFEFIELCGKNNHRINMELGLQTIHHNEMETIGRANDLEKVKKALAIFKEKKIEYEVSIIYAIPGQTVESFIDTIEFLISQGCKKIKAYPLRIPHNSKMENEKIKNCIKERRYKSNISTVGSSYSFPEENRTDMDYIAERLNTGLLNTDIHKQYEPDPGFKYKEATPFQWEIISIDPSAAKNPVLFELVVEYLGQTSSEIGSKNPLEAIAILGKCFKYRMNNNIMKMVSDLLSGEFPLESGKIPNFKLSDLLNSERRVKPRPIELQHNSKKYKCKIRISKSGNLYIYREVIDIEN